MYKYLFGIVLLGIVVLVHEFGHFLFARIFGVRVEIFSIGFGKPLFKKKSGDTEYRISLVPLGGYVKMLGESTADAAEVAENEIQYSFSGKKWWQKVLIVSAGPFFNLIFAFVVFVFVSFFMFSAPASVLEFVSPDGAACAAGISDGDKMVELNGEPVAVWEDISITSMPVSDDGTCREINVKVEKAFTKEIKAYTFHPKAGTYKNMLGEEKKRCEIGVVRAPREAKIALLKKFEGLKNGDLALSVDGKPVNRFYELAAALEKPFKTMKILRENKEITVDFPENMPEKPEIVYGGMVVSKVDEGSYSEKVGVKKGDLIVAVDNEKVTAPFQFYAKMGKLKEGERVKLSIIRDFEPQDIEFTASFDEKEDEMTGLQRKRMNWGADFDYDFDLPEVYARRNNLFTFPIRFAAKEMTEIISTTFKGFAYMISGKLSAKGLGGPIMIFDISKRAADAGFRYFLMMMAMISINLGIINLFPIPVLDGGYVVIYGFEGITGKVIPQKIKERALTVGLVLLSLLMVFAIFNDFTRYIPMFFNHN